MVSSNNTTRTPAGSQTIVQLADALGPITWMADIADHLVEQVTENILDHQRAAGGNFGPVDGLNWIIHSLGAAIADARKLAEALAQESAA